MEKLELNLENCYGIKKLNESIEFKKINNKTGIKESINACLIYASNGTMKTSFANTFLDIENDKETIDRIEPNNSTIREIRIDGKIINKDDILVIQTYVEGYDSNNKSKLLASKKLKKEYDDIWNEIGKNKDIFLKEIKKISGISNINEIEREIINIFKENDIDDFCTVLEKTKQKYKIEEVEILKNIKYKEVVNEDIEKALSLEAVSNALSDYMKKYDEILEQSELYKPGIFDNTRAKISLKSLKDNSFFEANHKIVLENQTVLNETEFENKMQEIEDKILADEEIKKNFKIIESTLDKKVGLRKFKDILYKNNTIYSKDTCIFIPERINILFTKNNAKRGNYPIGVYFNKRLGKFIAQVSKLNENKKNTKKPTHIGVFNTPEEAFLAYKTEKEKYIKEVANYYKEKYDNFPIVAYNALCDYKVEITD